MSNFIKLSNDKLDEVKSKLDNLPSLISGFDTHESKTTAQHLSEIRNASVRGINNTGGIGDGSENHTSVALGYDRSAGQARALLVDASGRQSVDVNSATISDLTSLFNASVSDINNLDQVGDGSSSHKSVALGYDRTGGKGRALLVDSSGRLQTSALGNTEGDGSGDSKHIHLDGSGNVQSTVVNTVNVAPANTTNGQHASQSQTFAVSLYGRTDIADESTAVPVKVDAAGVVQTSGSGGGSSATNTFNSQATNVLAPVAPATQRITEGANIDLQGTKSIHITLVSSSADVQADVNAQVEFSDDGTTFFTDHTGASALFTLSSDIQGVSRGLYVFNISLEPIQPRARYMRIIYNHMDNSGSNISVTAHIAQLIV